MSLRAALVAAVEPLPAPTGGIVLVLSTAGPPPAVALLSAGSVLVSEASISVAVVRGSSVVSRLGGAAVLLVPHDGGALRAEIGNASARRAGPLDVIEGSILNIRPSAELPWLLAMNFTPKDPASAEHYISHWRNVRQWLAGGAHGDGPLPPLADPKKH